MRTTLEETKDDLIEKAASLAADRKGAGSPPGETAVQLLKIFYRHVAPEDITAWARDHMAAYKVPKIVEFVETLPKSGSGKVMWRLLQEREPARSDS